MRKALGQFEGRWNRQTGLDRMYFLDAAQTEVPRLAAGLAEIFRASSMGVVLTGTWWMADFIRVPGELLENGGAPFGRLKSAVEGWAREFNLTKDGAPPDWIMEAVAHTFSRWTRAGKPDCEISLGGFSETLPCIDYSLHVPPFQITAWNPSFGESKRAVERALKGELARLETHLMLQLDRIEGEARSGGMTEASARFSRDHYLWAARFQLGGIEVREIVNLSTVLGRAASRAIQEILASVGLTKRKGKRGRPAEN